MSRRDDIRHAMAHAVDLDRTPSDMRICYLRSSERGTAVPFMLGSVFTVEAFDSEEATRRWALELHRSGMAIAPGDVLVTERTTVGEYLREIRGEGYEH